VHIMFHLASEGIPTDDMSLHDAMLSHKETSFRTFCDRVYGKKQDSGGIVQIEIGGYFVAMGNEELSIGRFEPFAGKCPSAKHESRVRAILSYCTK